MTTLALQCSGCRRHCRASGQTGLAGGASRLAEFRGRRLGARHGSQLKSSAPGSTTTQLTATPVRVSRPAGLSARVLPSGSSPGLTAKSCESWIGAGIGATVCEPRRLRRAVLGRKLGYKGDVKIYGTRRRGLNDSAPGVAQLATARPLHDGSRLRIRGRLSRSTRVLVRALDRSRKQLIVAEFPVGARRPRLVAASFEQTTKLRLRVRGRHRERPRVSLGGVEPVAVRFSRLRRR